ncbi:fungal-specific transcription factor domain-containing protein [Aspergillus avenaceus]|uniref:Fungal-specific transcription factor domain-containing protein n=1 Tax=Aspergillus avenaceus TaxID=36643 RepID=A0A5N6TS80_ASPAV|nr:fungal-specific transcription factor domain-containing protein [Aspergillus avenaceus]
MGVRSRTGCLACKRRKRRCDEERPACKNCQVRGLVCPYISAGGNPGPLKLKIYRGDRPSLSLRKRDQWHFLTVSSYDVGRLSSEHSPATTSVASDTADDAPPKPLYPMITGHSIPGSVVDQCDGVEKQLFQYYLQVICRARVFEDGSSNLYRSLVVPLCSKEGPLIYAVLSVSANDRRGESDSPFVNYEQLCLSYKSRALRMLRQSLGEHDQANEALMSCLILCSLEIASGCQPDWIRHVQGAVAIIKSFARSIDPEILFFAYSYFQSRATFFRTTACKDEDKDTADRPDRFWSGPTFKDSDGDVRDAPTKKEGKTIILPHVGCSLSLLSIIAQATDLVTQKQHLRGRGNSSLTDEDEMMRRAMSLRSDLVLLKEENPSGSDYLATCAQCFHMAAHMYLQLACDIPLTQPTLQAILSKLLDHIGMVVHEDQERQLFPMWPLFLAGCLSTTDEQRLRVLNYYTVLTYSWPISNVPIARQATETIWKYRDLNPDDHRNGFDWQMVISQMNWKLALS